MTARLGPRCTDGWRRLPRFTLTSPRTGFLHPKTRAPPALLGPCFKTGRTAATRRQRRSRGEGEDTRPPRAARPLQRIHARNAPRPTLGPRPQPRPRAISSRRGRATAKSPTPRSCGLEAILADESGRKVRGRHRGSLAADASPTAAGKTRRSGSRGTRGASTPR